MSQLKSQLNKYRAERAVGIGLMAGGGAALIAGEVIMILSGVRAENANLQNYSSFYNPLWRVGFSTAMVGVGALAPGIPLYVIGTRRAKMIKRRIAKIGADMPRTDKP
ncbi:MAG: hypothetical protein JSS76_18875 [Bacteroidetes bacterium]|nr:hypothetical protein [Bacteroidota bacterium]